MRAETRTRPPNVRWRVRAATVRRVDATSSWVRRGEEATLAPGLVNLLGEFSARNASLDVDAVADRLRDDRVEVVVAAAGERILGTASLVLLVTLTDGLVGRVEDVVVSDEARGAGLGRRLMEALHERAGQLNLGYLDLTSRPSREAANAMYTSLDYERRDTNVYRLTLRR